MLAEEEGRQLLLSKYALDCHAYNMAFEGVTWQVCDLRFWLNGEFALAAFDNAQRTRIARSELVNKDNDEYGTRGGEVTRDHVFCLSLDEVARYLATDANTHSHVGIARKDLEAIPTEYAKSRHINYDTIGGGVVWWLRSPGDDAAFASAVSPFDSVRSDGYVVEYEGSSVRPALWIGNTGA